jgi:predicted nuclease of predicted toxin-antitoxin system
VKLLFDENLSRKLVTRLAELYPGSRHVVEFDLTERPDSEIWEFARTHDFTVVTTDADFMRSPLRAVHRRKYLAKALAPSDQRR